MTEFEPDWSLSPADELSVALSLALDGVPGWTGATDDQMAAVAAAVIERIDAAWMRDVLRYRKSALPQGDLRSAYNAACDRLDVLASKIETGA